MMIKNKEIEKRIKPNQPEQGRNKPTTRDKKDTWSSGNINKRK